MAGEIELKGTLRIKSKTAAAWTAANPVLAANEPGRETDTGKYKIGDGQTAWNSLPYESGGAVKSAPFVTQYYSSAITTNKVNYIVNNRYTASVTLASPLDNPDAPSVVFIQMVGGEVALTDEKGTNIRCLNGTTELEVKTARYYGYGLVVCAYVEYYQCWFVNPVGGNLIYKNN